MILAALAAACGGEEGGPIDPSDTDGVDSMLPTAGGGGDEAGDETGAEPDNGGCVHKVNSGEELFKHVCQFEYDVTFSVDVDPVVGGSFTKSHLQQVVTVNSSSYENPLVAACCTDITEADEYPSGDLCDLPHYRNCYRDFVEHICRLPGSWLDKFASEVNAGNGGEALSEAAKEWRKQSRRQECFDHFWGQDGLETADMCTVGAETFFVHDDFTPSWSIAVGTPKLATVVDNLVLTVSSQLSGIEELPQDFDTCQDLTTNDQAPPFATASSGSFYYTDGTIPIDVDGPEWNQEPIAGSGEFSQFSSIRLYESGSDLSVGAWSLVEDAPTTVGTTSIQANVDLFRLELMGEHLATPSTGSTKVIAAGAATFELSARIDGIGYDVPARNATMIRFSPLAAGVRDCPSSAIGCWSHNAFTIGYEDSAENAWTLSIPATLWVLPATFAP